MYFLYGNHRKLWSGLTITTLSALKSYDPKTENRIPLCHSSSLFYSNNNSVLYFQITFFKQRFCTIILYGQWRWCWWVGFTDYLRFVVNVREGAEGITMEVAMVGLEEGTPQLPHQEGDWHEFNATGA